jgi:hypothetical protein
MTSYDVYARIFTNKYQNDVLEKINIFRWVFPGTCIPELLSEYLFVDFPTWYANRKKICDNTEIVNLIKLSTYSSTSLGHFEWSIRFYQQYTSEYWDRETGLDYRIENKLHIFVLSSIYCCKCGEPIQVKCNYKH